MTTDDDCLRALAAALNAARDAEGIPAGEWVDADFLVEDGFTPEGAAFVSAASPDVVLGLLDRLRAAEVAALDAYDEAHRPRYRGRPVSAHESIYRARPCPACGARPGERCATQSGKPTASHQQRWVETPGVTT